MLCQPPEIWTYDADRQTLANYQERTPLAILVDMICKFSLYQPQDDAKQVQQLALAALQRGEYDLVSSEQRPQAAQKSDAVGES